MHDCELIPALKRQLAREIVEALRGWTPTEAYYAIRLHPSRVSDLRHGRLQRFSAEKLIEILHRLGRTVTLTVGKGAEVSKASRGSTAKRVSLAELTAVAGETSAPFRD